MVNIIKNAIARASHFSAAMIWLEKRLKENIDFQNQFLNLLQTLSNCGIKNSKNKKNVFFIAVGKSAQIAQLTTNMLISVGISARFIHATEAIHGDLGVINKSNKNQLFTLICQDSSKA